MSSFFGNRRPASGLSGQPPGSFNDPSFGDTDTQASSNAGTWQGEAAQQEEMDARAKTSGYPGHQQAPPAYPQEQYSGQTSHLSVPPGSNQYAASSAYNQYTGPGADSSLLAPNSLARSDTIASNFTQQSAAASLSEMSQPGMPTDGAVWKLGRHDPVLPDYRGIPVKPNTTIYQPGEANGGVWHDDWKVQTKNKQQKAFVDTWDNLAGQCECGFGRGLPVQKNLCPKFYQDHLNNAREGIRILKQQFFNKRDKVTVAAWDQVLDSGDTFGKPVRGECG